MKATTRSNPKRTLPLLGALLFFTFFLLLSCDDVESDDDKDAPPSIALSGKGASGSLHLGDGVKVDDIITLSAKLKGVTAITWKILDNTADKYGTIDQATSRYKAPEVWKEAVPAGGIQFTIEASSTADPSVKVSRPITIKTDSFPNDLVINGGNRGTYSSYSAMNKDIVIYLGVSVIDINTFQSIQLTSVTMPKSVTLIESLAFLNNQLSSVTIPESVGVIDNGAFFDNPDLTEVILSQAVWDTVKANTQTFGAQVTSYKTHSGTVLASIAITTPPTSIMTGAANAVTLAATTIPTTATVTWAVDDTSIATIVATTGVLTGVAAGTVKVTATAGIVSQSVNITVQ